MMTKQHDYTSRVSWTGNRGAGTRTYKGYDRTWDICVPGKPVVHCSNDPLLGGDSTLMNPEDLLLSALSACHMLWYLHLASSAGVVVHAYEDSPIGIGEVAADGSGAFKEATLRPIVTISQDSDPVRAREIHGDIHKYCFIARSVNFPVHHAPEIHKANR